MPSDQARGSNRTKRRAKIAGIARLIPLAAPIIVANAIVGNGLDEHAGLSYFLIGVAVMAGIVAAEGGILALGGLLAARSLRPRRRWQYWILALCYAGPVAAFIWIAVRYPHTGSGDGGRAMAAGLSAMFCAVGVLLMLGRAAAWGRLREGFFIIRPAWAGGRAGSDDGLLPLASVSRGRPADRWLIPPADGEDT